MPDVHASTSREISISTNTHRLRVLHALGQLQRGGIETWLYHLAKRLKPHGIDCHVLTRTDAQQPYTQDFVDAGVTLLPCLGERNPARYFRNIKRIITEHGPYDILHSHGPSISNIQLSLYGRLLGIPSVLLHSHSNPRPMLARKGMGTRLYNRALVHLGRALATYRASISSSSAEWMYGARWSEHPNMVVVPLGIDFEPFFRKPDPQLRALTGIPQGRFVIGHVGRYVPVKNHAYLVEIADALLRRSKEFHFLLVGDGPLRSGIEGLIHERNMSTHFTLIPDSTAVPSLMCNTMDAFVLPSLYEGIPLSVLEAQVSALPCLIADNITSEAVIEPRLITRLSINADPDLWAERILALRDSRPQLDPQSHRETILASRFNIDSSVAAIAGLYRHLAATRQSDR